MQGLADFLDAELTPMVRRMAYRPRHDPDAAADNAAIRAMVWQGLVSLGLTDLPTAAAAAPGPTTAAPDPAVGIQTELVTVAERLGAALYQGPLLDTLTAIDLLTRGDERHLLDPGASVALAVRDSGTGNPAEPAGLSVDPQTGAIDALRSFVNCAADVDHLLVVGRTPDGPRIALVPRAHPTVRLRRHVELGEGELYQVRFTGTPPTAWLNDRPEWAQALAYARIRQAGYLVGLSQGALDLAVAHARRRHQFGQAIGRFQWIAFRLSALAARLDAVRLLVHDAAAEVDRGGDPGLPAASCLATAADLARTMTTETLQVHGAAGLVTDSDAQLFHRRSAVESSWLGTPTQLRAEALPLLRDELTA